MQTKNKTPTIMPKLNLRLNLKCNTGFTLVEILVALAILSISLSAVLYVINQNTTNLIHLKDKTFAHWVAMNKVAEFRVNPSLIQKSRRLSGHYTLAEKEWKWTAQLSRTEDKDLDRLNIEIYNSDDEEKITSLTSFMTFALLDKK
jgi:general secretion pathway protein I